MTAPLSYRHVSYIKFVFDKAYRRTDKLGKIHLVIVRLYVELKSNPMETECCSNARLVVIKAELSVAKFTHISTVATCPMKIKQKVAATAYEKPEM